MTTVVEERPVLALAEDEIKGKRFVSVRLGKESSGFSYLPRHAHIPDSYHVYYVDDVRKGSFTKATMLLGQFVFEFEGAFYDAIALRPGSTNRLYYSNQDETGLSGDNRVLSYHELTPEEIEDTKRRFLALALAHPDHQGKIEEILSYLPD